jgi:hypothetical protein
VAHGLALGGGPARAAGGVPAGAPALGAARAGRRRPGRAARAAAGPGGRTREAAWGVGRRRGRLVPLAKGGERASHAAGQATGGSAPACQRPTGGRGPRAPRRPPGRRAPPSSRGGRRASAAPGHGDAPAHGSTASRRSRALLRQPGGCSSGHGGGGPRGRRACGRPITRVAPRCHAERTWAWWQTKDRRLGVRWARVAPCVEAFLALATLHSGIQRLIVG